MYRVDVVACSVAEAVRRAGGWIFDHTMQGWAVTVVVPRPHDVRPLQILGASVCESRSDRLAAQILLDADGGPEVSPVEHRLSSAAGHFKAQALIAAQLPPMVERSEKLFAAAPSAPPGYPSGGRSRWPNVKIVDAQPLTVTRSS